MSEYKKKIVPKYCFKQELKNELLKGLKLTYLSEKCEISYSHLSRILTGHVEINKCVGEYIMLNIGYSQKEIKSLFDYYFKKVE